jgi:hypothetical protein
VLGAALWGLWGAADSQERSGPQFVEQAHAAPEAAEPMSSRASARAQLQSDPLQFLKDARRDYDRKVKDYVCTFAKQEYIGGRLTDIQESNVKFREGPYSVFMHVTKNAGKARRVLYVEEGLVKDGEEYAIIQPEGAIARLFVDSVERAIQSEEVRRASRRAINEFGFARSLGLIIRYAEMTRNQGNLKLRYVGEGSVDGRPTYVLERRLPKEGLGTIWPDVLLVAHIDQEWLVPVSCTSYADLHGSQLLGRYVYTHVNFNVGLTDQDFNRKTYGL